MAEQILYSGGLDIRWICNACFEIKLPGGKTILIDPYIEECQTKPFELDKIEGADYILLTHIHFDHMLDVENLWQRFGSKVFVGNLSATELCRLQKVPAGALYRVQNNMEWQFDDVRIKALPARHTEWKKGVFLENLAQANQNRPQHEEQSMWLGFLEMLNYSITAADGTSVLVWGGMPTEDQVHLFQSYCPDLALMHISPNQNLDVFKRLVQAINPRFLVPHHYDMTELMLKENPHMIQDKDAMTPRALVEHLAETVPQINPQSKFVEFQRGVWYKLAASMRPA